MTANLATKIIRSLNTYANCNADSSGHVIVTAADCAELATEYGVGVEAVLNLAAAAGIRAA
jgi:hypothetical protein